MKDRIWTQIQFGQAGSIFLILLSVIYLAELQAAAVDVDAVDIGHASGFETHAIRRPKVVWFGKTKSRIGDYARVTHKFGRSVGHNYTSDYKFSLEITTSDVAELKLDGKIHTVYRPTDEDDPGLLQDFVAFYIEERTGISDIEVNFDAYNSSFSATIRIGQSSEEIWQLKANQEWALGDVFPEISGTLSNGSRTLGIAGQPDASNSDRFPGIYEHGNLLSGRVNNREYIFRNDLGPELKILLLAAMEILSITER